MEEDASNDVESVHSDDKCDKEGKPIMKLLRRIVSDDKKQNTVLTNEQIMEILMDEFIPDLHEHHNLEVSIYINVTKKFLKDWPQWEDLDKTIHQLKQNNNVADIEKVLQTQYTNLKAYLMKMLNFTKPLAKKKLEVIEETEKALKAQRAADSEKEPSKDDVIMEIHCTSDQLKTVFYRHPHPDQNYTVFNNAQTNPSTIVLQVPEHNSILNWWDIKLQINAKNGLYITRTTVHESKHMLINKNLNIDSSITSLKNCIEEKPMGTCRKWSKEYLTTFLSKLRHKYEDTDLEESVDIIVNTLNQDLLGLPDTLEVPKLYRKHLSKYPYVRYLYTDVPEAKKDKVSMNYDLQLEETICPRYQIYFGKIPMETDVSDSLNINAIQLQCKFCSVDFQGPNMFSQLKDHIWLNHLNEPYWQCTNCKKMFNMVILSRNRWSHKCEK